MTIKPGDIIELGLSPTIKVGESFVFLKPHASIRRVMQGDYHAEIEDMTQELRRLFAKALGTEVDMVDGVYGALGKVGDTEQLRAWALKEVGDASVTVEVAKAPAQGAQGQAPGAVPGKKLSIKVGGPGALAKPGASGKIKL